MSIPIVVIPGDDPPQIVGSSHLDRLRQLSRVVLYQDRPKDEAELIQRTSKATAVINSRGQVKWPGHVLRELPQLKMITACGIGTDSIDLEAARKLGIVVCNVPERTARFVAEHAFAMMCAISRRTAWMTSQLKQGRWPHELSVSLSGKTLGVIGTGNIGCEMIRLARSIDMDVLAWSFHPSEEKARRYGFQYASFDEVLGTSDVISLHVKLTEESRHLIGERELNLMKPTAILVNTSRGPVVETNGLVEALNDNRIFGAALDVFDVEPIPKNHPLLACENVVLTPHSADQTPEGIDLLNEGCVDNVLGFLSGRTQNVVV
ncbi:MAG: D-2-hydroxyacid dehydrogenase [Planctomycetaceae bacterium]